MSVQLNLNLNTEINIMDIIERFLKYVSFDTQSAEDSDSVPSTAKQLVFAKALRDELKEEGFDDVEMDEMGYVYATLKSNCLQSRSIGPRCMESTAFNWDPLCHDAWNSLHSIRIHCTTLHGIHCSVFECSTFHAAW